MTPPTLSQIGRSTSSDAPAEEGSTGKVLSSRYRYVDRAWKAGNGED